MHFVLTARIETILLPFGLHLQIAGLVLGHPQSDREASGRSSVVPSP